MTDERWFDEVLRSGDEQAPVALRVAVRSRVAQERSEDQTRQRSRLWRRLAAVAAMVVLVGSVVVGLVSRGGDESESTGSGAGAGARCVGGVAMDGTWFFRDHYNDGRLNAEALGERLGQIEHEFDCESATPDGLDTGVWALGEQLGSEVRAVPGRSPSDTIAVVSDEGVHLYTVEGFDEVADVIQSVIVEIGINSDFDGTTRFAVINSGEVIESLLDTLAAAPTDPSPPIDDPRYFVEFVHDTGLVTVIPYFVDNSVLGDRTVGGTWRTAVDDALAAAPATETVDGLIIAGPDGPFGVHPIGSCRHDRTDASVLGGDQLLATYDPALELRWWLNAVEPGGTTPATQSQIGATLVVPNAVGTMIVETLLTETGGLNPQQGCFTIAIDLDGAAANPDDVLPQGMLECAVTDRQPTVEEHLAGEAPTFSTMDVAVQDWIERASASGLTTRMSPYSTVVDLVDADGRTQVVLVLADGGNGWYVQTEQVCASG